MKQRLRFTCILSLLLLGGFTTAAQAQENATINVLFLTKSSGYEHGVIKQENGQPSHAGNVMKQMAEKTPLQVVVTKDAGKITPKLLKQVDVLLFYTSGNLFKEGTDGNPPMTKKQGKAFLQWIREGGSFVGVHSATDTFKNWTENGENVYINMIGGRFDGHSSSNKNGVLTIRKHPITNHLDREWELKDEFYYFNSTTENREPLTVLQPETVDSGDMEGRDPYMNSWIKTYGSGRVFYTALGHRPDVWTNQKFQQLLYNGIRWANNAGQ